MSWNTHMKSLKNIYYWIISRIIGSKPLAPMTKTQISQASISYTNSTKHRHDFLLPHTFGLQITYGKENLKFSSDMCIVQYLSSWEIKGLPNLWICFDFSKEWHMDCRTIYFTFFPSHNFFMLLSHCRFLHYTRKTNQAAVRRDGISTHSVSLCLLCSPGRVCATVSLHHLCFSSQKLEKLSWPHCLTLHTLLWLGIPSFRNWVGLSDVNLDICAK